MAKKQAVAVYRIVDVVGVSETSWEDAGRNAVETAAGSLRDLRVAEVTKMDMKVENGKVAGFRTRVALSFKYEALGRSLDIRTASMTATPMQSHTRIEHPRLYR